MSIVYSPDMPAVYEAIRSWVIYQTGIENNSVRWADQPAPRAEFPRAVLTILSADGQLGWDEQRFEAGGGMTEYVTGPREMVVQIDIHTKTRADQSPLEEIDVTALEAFDYMRRLLSSVAADRAIGYLVAVGTGIVEHSDVRDLSELVGSQYEKRASVDVTFGYNVIREDNGKGWIANVAPVTIEEN